MKVREIYYGWYIVAAGTLCIFAALGLGRFALGMILPSMGTVLKLSASEMGFISTSNFAGYLFAVLICLVWGQVLSARHTISLALLASGLSMGLMSFINGYKSASFFYFLTGIGSGLANIPTMALVSNWFRPNLRGRAAGFIVMGSGFGILLSGFMVPILNQKYLIDGWRISWLILSGIVILSSIVCFLIIRNGPEDMGLTPEGSGHGPGNPEKEGRAKTGFSGGVSLRTIIHLSSIYFCFGASYTIYVTFIVVSFTGERGLSEAFAGGLWALIGGVSLFSGPIPGWIADWAGRKIALLVVFGMQSLAYLFAGLPYGHGILPWASVLCYGIAAWGIPGIMTAIVADFAGPAYTARLFAIVTLIMAVGQVIGPAVGGALSDFTNSFSTAFFLASGIALSGLLLSSTLKI
ncbi:Transporter, MFS superfamily [Dissulfuribacter thermophilus]|uniref:Transporter, MFS superfamily n=1 Tax=Dissulfuribacter thermophilus TaxID=1156395 RepID=A0A1B9F8J3_9BACT|nr:YbfB/YjiJ family MFS transporter [Dissulfuribacter thermophilus]OCC16259.1 Transporter, MFS superfamily [Dissulfuribacter thermophilus]